MPDLLDRIRSEMSTRLPKPRPLDDEHSRRDAALQALGDVDRARASAPAASATRPRSRARAAAATTSQRKRAPRGSIA